MLKLSASFPAGYSANSPVFLSKRVFTEVGKFVRGSNIRWRGRSFAASDIRKAHKSGRKCSKDERRAMLESFVSKYRAINAGKFPTASEARKQVGGSYYVVKNLLQETMYKSKLSPLEIMNRSILRKEVAIETVMVTEAETVSSSDVKETVNVKGRQESETSTEVDRGFVKPIRPSVHSDFVAKRGHLQKEETFQISQLHHKEMDGKEEEADSEGLIHSDGPDLEAEKHERSHGISKFERDIPEKQNVMDEEPPKKSTLWDNLKSLTNDIINIWRKP